jgi:predicted lipoprotein with Yx(FWY)xxD motif
MNATFYLKKMPWIFSISLMGALVFSACQPAPASAIPVTGNTVPTALPNYTSATETVAPSQTAAPAVPEAEINVLMDPKLGNILVGNKGMTLYMYTVDPPDQSTCTGGCSKAWPALLTQGSPVLGPGVDKSMVGAATLADGSKVVTYNHMALYYWAKDTKPGDTTGQNVGKVWFVVSPDGKSVTGALAAPTAVPVPSQTAAPATPEAEINVVKDPKLGNILVGNKGMTLYVFTMNPPDQSTCTGGCLQAWPALLTQDKPVLGPGVIPSMIGMLTLADGSKIVTYDHKALYYWAKDARPGDTTGQDVGKVWFVISPTGNTIISTLAAPAPAPMRVPTMMPPAPKYSPKY